MKCFFVGVGLLLTLSFAAQAEDYQNPMDGKTYVAPQGWQVYKPEGAAKASKERVQILGVRLLQAQTEMSDRVAVPDMVAFVQQAQHAASDVFESDRPGAHLMLQFTCVPGSSKVQVAYQGEVSRQLLPVLLDRLGRVDALKVSGEVKFQVELMIPPMADMQPG